MESRYASNDKKVPKDLFEEYNNVVVSCAIEDLQNWARPVLKEFAKSESLKKITPSSWSFFKTDDSLEKAKIEKFFAELEDSLSQPVNRPKNYEFLVMKFGMEKGGLEVCQEGVGASKGSVCEESVMLEITGVSVVYSLRDRGSRL